MGTVRAVVADPVGRSVVGGWTGTPYACRSKHQREPGYPPSDAAEQGDLRCPWFRPKAIETSADSALCE